MKYTSNKILLPLFLFLLVAVISCGKKFLNEPPRGATINDLLNNPQDGAQRIIGAVYNRLYDWETHSFSWIGISSITSDDADKGSSAGDGGGDKIELDGWLISPTNISFNEVWEGNFEGIGRACYAIKFINEMSLSPVEKDRYIGEAKFLRAYYYWNLLRVFGGVPKIDKVLTSQADIETASIRASAAEIYAFIESDLTEAAAKLPTVIPVTERGRASKAAAQALLAKVYLYQSKWAQSKSMCDILIGSGQFSLLSNYGLIWREAGEFSAESIWEVNAVAVNPPKGIQQYTEVQGMRGSGAGDFGWGFNTPSQNLVNVYEPGDLRKAATILVSGSTLWDGFVTSNTLPNPYYNYKAYVSLTAESYFDRGQSNKNLRVCRYGEILLIKAEVENELNDTTASKIALNQLRIRAGLLPVLAISQASMRDKIYKERRVEMAFEHDRMFDLRRTGRAAAVLQALGKPYVSPKHNLFPIPQRQIDLSGNKITQNPGY
ncbi:MAG: RagB/SusD family nutrient uptake outer membrane protein [Chitinophagaceae bacterium]|nr:RagB/SusD family nutrient uptake outer membrane protein [Chitinophagaceae bacterium]